MQATLSRRVFVHTCTGSSSSRRLSITIHPGSLCHHSSRPLKSGTLRCLSSRGKNPHEDAGKQSNNDEQHGLKPQNPQQRIPRIEKQPQQLSGPERKHAPQDPPRENPWMAVPRAVLEEESLRLQDAFSKSTGKIRLEDCLDVFQAWIRHAATEGIQAAKCSESLLFAMENQYRNQPRTVVQPNFACYEAVIEAYSKCHDGGQEAAERAETILKHLARQDFANTEHKHKFKLLRRLLNLVVEAWCSSNSIHAGDRVDQLRHIMASAGIMGDTTTIELHMRAWLKSRHEHAPENVLRLLVETVEQAQHASSQKSQLQQQHGLQQRTGEDEDAGVTPTIGMFHSAMGALAKSATSYHRRSIRQVACQIQELLEIILTRHGEWGIQPTLRTFMICLGIWERVEKVEKKGEAAQRAHAILSYMIQSKYNVDNNYHGPERMLLNSHSGTFEPVAVINNTSFTSVIAAYCHAGQTDRAESLYHQLIDLYRANRDHRLKPTVDMFNTLLAGYKTNPEKVIELMKLQQDVAKKPNNHSSCRLNLRTFNILLNSLKISGQALGALELLEWLEVRGDKVQNTENDPLQNSDKFANLFRRETAERLGSPNVVSYSTVLEALGKKGLIETALTVMDRMERNRIQPSMVAYTTIIHAYAPLNDPSKVAKAATLFGKVRAMQQPDVICVGSFLQVCRKALPPEQASAVHLAFEAYHSLEKSERNEVIFLMMGRIIRSSTAGRSDNTSTAAEQLKAIARDCSEAGCLSNAAFKLLDPLQDKESFASRLALDASTQSSWGRRVPRSDRAFQ